MKPLLVQIVIAALILQSSIIVSSSSLSFDGSRSELSHLIVLGPGLLLLSSFRGTFAEKRKRSKNVQEEQVENEEPAEEDKAEEASKAVANHIIQELKEKAKKVQAQNKLENNNKAPQTDIDKRKVSPQNDAEMDPMKCFPKALCGVSSEVAQISKKQKNGLITDYLFLMRAIARNPSVVEEVARPSKKKNKPSSDDEPQDDLEQNDDEADNSSEEEDEEEDDEDSGEGEEEEDEDENAQDDLEDSSYKSKTAKKSKSKRKPLSPDDADHEAYLKEKLAMDQLYKETLDKETWNDDNWWGAYGNDGPVVNKNKRRPSRFRTDKPGDDGTTSGKPGGGVTSFFSNLFSFGSSSASPGNRGMSPYEEVGRDFSSSAEVVPGIGMDETKEILETAIEIGKGFDRPSQCNEIFNGCKYDYTDLLYMIDEMRHSLRDKASRGKRKGNKKAKTAVEVNHHQQQTSSSKEGSSDEGFKKTKSRYRVTPKGSKNKKNKQIKKKRPTKSDTEDRVVIPNSHEKLEKLTPHHHTHNKHHHYNHNHHNSPNTGQSGESSPGFSLTNMFSSWIG